MFVKTNTSWSLATSLIDHDGFDPNVLPHINTRIGGARIKTNGCHSELA